MIVSRHMAHLVATGHVTQHRAPAGPITRNTPRRDRRIQIRRDTTAGPIACHVVITSSHRSRNGHAATLNPPSLAALGHHRLDTYIAAWLARHDRAWLAHRGNPDLPTTDHQITDALHNHLDPDTLHTRWITKWADQPVWVIHWQLEHDRPVLLHAGTPRLPFTTRPPRPGDIAGRHVIDDGVHDHDRGYYGAGVPPVPAHTELADRGYTSELGRALTGAGEAIDPTLLHPHWTRDATEHHADARDRHRAAQQLVRQADHRRKEAS